MGVLFLGFCFYSDLKTAVACDEKEPTQDGVWNKASRKGEGIWNRIEGAQRECVSSNYVWSTCVSVGWDGFWLSRKPLPK